MPRDDTGIFCQQKQAGSGGQAHSSPQTRLVGTGAVTEALPGPPRMLPTSEGLVSLQQQSLTQNHSQFRVLSLPCNHIDAQSPCTISKTIYAHVCWNPSM